MKAQTLTNLALTLRILLHGSKLILKTAPGKSAHKIFFSCNTATLPLGGSILTSIS